MGMFFMKSLDFVLFLFGLYTICLAVSKMQSASAVILSELFAKSESKNLIKS